MQVDRRCKFFIWRSNTFRDRMDYYSEMYTVESLKSDWTKGFKEFLKKSKNNLSFALGVLFMYCDCECVCCNNIS